ncbi:MAG: hypothetical protein LBG79_08785 [Spirochaetaceae bacterium]|nr:hypothetical protein [Spirochaetaceae bacterium]
MKRDRVPETRDADVPNLPESSFETSKGTQLPRGYIPQYAREEAQLFTKEFLAQNSKSASGLKHRFFYNEKGEACLEYTVTPKHGYIWDTPTWTGSLWGSITGSISGKNIYYTQTKKNQDETYYSIEKRRKDSAFREIEKIVLQIATEYDYDFYAYNGQTVKYRDPNVKKAVCDGYADAVVRAFANHRLVQKTEKWTSEKGNHAWNVIALKDGREIYCDATWYDGNSIDDNGYVVHIPAQNPVDLTFDEAEFNSLGGAVDKTTGGLLAVHFAWNDAVLVN